MVASFLLLPLVGVAVWVGLRARRIREDPARMLEALRSEAAPVLPEAASVGASGRTEVSRYGPGNLVDWVDGGAEALLRAGFRKAVVATYGFSDGTEVEVAVISFVSAERARAWLEGERPPDARPLGESGTGWVAADVAGATQGAVALRALTMVPDEDSEGTLARIVRVWLERSR